ncbi:MAG: DUF4153 domain-containing protein [Syntrophomonadaceae bacterium]
MGTSILICYMISLHTEPDLTVQKLMFTLLLGAFLGVAVQFSCERFGRLSRRRAVVYGIAALLIAAYYTILLPAPSISFEVRIRTLVAVFALFCAFLWVPSHGNKADFNQIALIHFKSVCTAVLYAAVLSAGCASIIATIDILLISVNGDIYGYTMTIIWVMFATLYYLSLLPHFNSEGGEEYIKDMAQYPRFLEILISYIAIPLVGAYTLVLAAYFIKILVTWNWPSGQLGGMVLAYSAAGIIIYILASRLENRFASYYQLIFPKVLIPVVIMQLVSVGIRLNAYGFTESRYYITLFGVFSLISGMVLSIKPVLNNGVIAILAASFAIFSVIPPVDAFTVSRISQINRLENMLSAEGILADGKLNPKQEVSLDLRVESTSILNYLDRRNYLQYLKWLPADFDTAMDMKKTFGFEPAYENSYGNHNYLYVQTDMREPVNIKGFDVFFNTSASTRTGNGYKDIYDFEIGNKKYKMQIETVTPQDIYVAVKDETGVELVGTGLYEFTRSLVGEVNSSKELMAPDKMTLDVASNSYKLRIIIQHANITLGSGHDSGAEYGMFVMFAAPESP